MERIEAKIPAADKKKLAQRAKKEKTTLSDLIRRMVKSYLKS